MVKKEIRKYRVGTMDFHGNKEEFEYFNEYDKAYEFSINQRAENDEVWIESLNSNSEYETMESYTHSDND